MRSHPGQQWIELLSTTAPRWSLGSSLHCDVLGEPLQLPHAPVTALLIAEDTGLAPITFLAETLKKERRHSLLALLGFSGAIPFRPAPSRIIINDMPAGVIATMPLMDEWSIPCRIAHADEAPGCSGGGVIELARHWLQQPHNGAATLYLGGGVAMVEAGIGLAREFNLEYQAVVIRG